MKQFLGILGAVLCLAMPARAADIDGLVKQLKDPDADVRRSAAKLLGEAGPEAKPAVAALSAALKDRDRYVRRYAAQSLGEIGPDAKAAVPSLATAMKDSNG